MAKKSDGYDDNDLYPDAHLDISEYDISSVPNDFNLMTILSFIDEGSILIPNFQRNFVWDIERASRLIESLILGLPVPQIFLYEEGKNKFLVIDGQQRLMSIYYFFKGRFPKKNMRAELRSIFDEQGSISDEILRDNKYFTDFKLGLETKFSEKRNKFDGLTYEELGGFQNQFKLRTIRNVVIRQNEPKFDESSKYEIFNRLNTGGANLKAQEIRSSLYHSPFYKSLYKLNASPDWRRLQKKKEPDLHMKDVEVLLRSMALLTSRESYAPPMTKFLNDFSGIRSGKTSKENMLLINIMANFLDECKKLPENIFWNRTKSRNFNIALFEAVLCAVCTTQYKKRKILPIALSKRKIDEVAGSSQFQKLLQEGTTKRTNIIDRIKLADKIINA